MLDEEQRTDIAVFRYGIIAPVLHGTNPGTASDYFRQVTAAELEVPHFGPIKYKPNTPKAWLSAYRINGLDGLMPQPRCDLGSSRVLTPEMEQRIRDLVAQYPKIPASLVYERLVSEDLVTTRSPSESTIRRFIRTRGLRTTTTPNVERRAWSKSEPNELWTLDYMHGPCINGSTVSTRLLAIIDDASRFIVLGRFLPSESYNDLAPRLVEAFARHGLPLALYCDNGASFSTRDLALACARLEVALVHSKPYTPQGRGKIERFFLTVRKRFLAALDPQTLTSLDALDAAFSQWLDADYHRRVHSGIGTTPLERFLNAQRPKRWIPRQELDLHFHHTLRRKVRSDCTVSVNGIRYEVPAEWIGHTVDLRSPLDDPSALTLYVAGAPILALKPLNVLHNDLAKPGISFATYRERES